ncbi:MAG: hypothetical protein A3C88_02905 [Candidatus Yanofskybacteria bacterium RIFCSPHIGHO2_02_FULL_50_12]|uniref:Histidine-specific methyltransferase SAM-dependent domain-containing protein n=1 Tax=Candidatus Yanofskybacteria bacterium RIFCSPHIGHO2_02_FULL_50_12 TaxID=1802685 RepID=A0A1F8FUX6_9BACT|nr:MAG: hypothetical protein A3C88_02905 [Candidatus Yanofskybacteria bacterium RIFCSPHIGHO2_02_FULL_50_12]
MAKYDSEWFKERAINCIKQIAPNTWDYSDSLLLYVPSATEAYEEIQQEETPYHTLVTKPETEFISKIAKEISKELPSEFNFIDLGPGTEHKERFFFDLLKKQGKQFTYFPVDISERFLEVAEDFSQKLGIPCKPILAPFEEVGRILPSGYRFISLGLTFINYRVEDILSLLKTMIGNDGCAFIDSHIRSRVDTEEIRSLYVDQVESMIIPKAELLELDWENDLENIEVNDKVEIWCTVKNPSSRMVEKGIKSGDRMIIFQSLRHDLEFLKEEIQKVFPNYQMHDIGSPFVGFLLKS